MGKNIKILVCAHKDSRLPQHEYFCPIQVGASLTSARFFPVLDNTGDNISDRNPHFCELTAHYWAWKNLKCDIIGLNHYRRFFDFHRPFPAFSPDRSFINIDSFLKETYRFPDLETLLNDYDIILSPKRHYPYNVATQYAIFHLVNDLNLLKEVIQHLTPEYAEAFHTFMYHCNAYSGYNMFITGRKHFDEYSQWLFSVLFELEKRVKLSAYPDQARLFGYLSERLINVYCIRHRLKIKYVPVIMPLEETFQNPSNLLYTLRRLSGKLTQWEAIHSLFNDRHYKYKGNLWDKLYHKEIIDKHHLKFNEHIYYNEDRLFIFQYLSHCQSAAYTTSPYYHYVTRKSSAMNLSQKNYTPKLCTFMDAFDLMTSLSATFPTYILRALSADYIKSSFLFYTQHSREIPFNELWDRMLRIRKNNYIHLPLSLKIKYALYGIRLILRAWLK